MPQTFSLPGNTSSYLPPELNDAFFQNLDSLLAQSEQKQLQNTLEDLNRRGILTSGQTLREVNENVLGPSLERRASFLLPLASQAAYAGREERFTREQQGTAFERQRQLNQEDFMRRLQEMEKQYDYQRGLLNLQKDLLPNQDSGFGFGEILGGVAGTGIGALFGGVGAGIGGGIGSRIGGSIGGKRNA